MTDLQCLLVVFRHEADRDRQIAGIAGRCGFGTMRSVGLITVFVNDPRRLLALPKGIVAGTIFPRHGPGRAIDRNDGHLMSDVLRDGETALLENYWGSYIFAIQGPEHVYVQPDPTGTMPCYFVDRGSFVAFTTDSALLQDAGLLDVSIDRNSIQKYLYFADLPIEQTALEGVSRILGGSAGIVNSNGFHVEQRWSPWHFIGQGAPSRPEQYAERLGRTVSTCVAALSSDYNSLLVAVSGGLDSSIIATSLSSRTDKTCLTVATDDAMGDERHYARALCEWLKTELREDFYAIDDIDLSRSCVAHKPYPCGRTQSLAYNAAVKRAARATRAEVLLTGNGGDNVFFHSQSARAVADRFQAEGFGFGLLGTIRDICALTGCSALAASRQALAIRRLPTPSYQWRFDPRFLADCVVAELSREPPTHPWLQAPAGAPRGKSAHIAMILRSQNHLEMLDRSEGLPVLNPLISQPIVELCLAIPTWLSCAGGRDRSVARSAFSERLPDLIINRRTKGGPDGFASRILKQYRSEIRERLMDGFLANWKIIDRSKIEAATRPDIGDHGESYVPLLYLVDTEAWIDHWRARRPSTALHQSE
jgi:asparagine synthase (glutamine-hydrolysing)